MAKSRVEIEFKAVKAGELKKAINSLDKATKSLGYQNSEIRGIADELHATAQSLGVPFSQIADDFNMVATELAF